jgi:ribosomal protein S18 acetylase RimI-like enzyme
MNTFHISCMELNDIEESAKVLSYAMLKNPLHVAVFQGEGENERRLIEQMFLELFLERPGIVLIAKAQDRIIGVMRMSSCVGKKEAFEPAEMESENVIKYRQAFWLNEWAKRDPKDQHWHLGPIGVLPSNRKQGVGSQLMQRFCNEVDSCNSKAYLETDLDENVRFYKKFGFELISESTIFQVDNKYMVRNPKTEF